MIRVIASDSDIAEGAAYLARICPVWERALPDLMPLPLRRWPAGFGAIRDAVVGQQVSTHAARAITARMTDAQLVTEAQIMAASDDTLRGAGLSRPKVKYLRAIAEARVDWSGLESMPDAQVISELTALPGIGKWTAEIYLKFALGRADAFAAGDLALAEAARLLYDLPERPGPAPLTELAENWRPWRAVAARGLWAYYRIAKNREGIT